MNIEYKEIVKCKMITQLFWQLFVLYFVAATSWAVVYGTPFAQ